MREVLEAALEAEARGERAALVTVVATEGSTPQKAAARMLVFADGRIFGTIGGGTALLSRSPAPSWSRRSGAARLVRLRARDSKTPDTHPRPKLHP